MFPSFPQHATLGSLLTAGMRVGAIDSMKRVGREVNANYSTTISPFANHAHGLAAKTFRGLVEADALVRSHSFVRFHGAFLPLDRESDWVQSCISGADGSSLRPTPAFGAVQSVDARYCTQCAELHLEEFGCAHWLVGHQIHSVHHCWIHGARLLSTCRACGSPFSRKGMTRLPLDPCVECGSSGGAAPPRTFPKAYWFYFELVKRILERRAPEVRPVARLSIISALGKLSLDEIEQQFLAGWGVKTTDDLASELGCQVRLSAVERLLRGSSVGASNYLIAAVVSFAMSKLKPDELSHALCELEVNNSDLGDSKPIDTNDELLGRLVAKAMELGYSIDAAKMFARGLSKSSISSAGHSSMSETTRFLEHLGCDLRQLVEAARAARLALWQGKDQKQARRKHLLEMRANGVPLIKLKDSTTYRWIKQYDPRWFKKHVTLHRKESITNRRIRMRGIAKAAISKGGHDRTSFRRSFRTSYVWLIHNDPKWFDKLFDRALIKSQLETKKRHQSIAMALIPGGDDRREVLQRVAKTTYSWLRLNDLVWLDTNFPAVNRSKVARRVEYRAVALDFLAKGFSRRADLLHVAPSAYEWLRKHDKEWYDEKLPALQRRRV